MNRTDLAEKTVVLISRDSEGVLLFRRRVIEEAISQGCRVAVISGDEGDLHDRLYRETGAELFEVRFSGSSINPFGELATLFSIRKLLARLRPDIVHCFTIRAVLYGLVASYLVRTPVRIATITGLGYAFTSSRSGLRRIAIWLYKMSLRKAHWVFFQNGDDLQFFRSIGLVSPQVSSEVPGSGVDIHKFSPRLIPRPATDGSVNVLMIGRILKDKGAMEYIEAARLLRSKGVSVNFEMVGGFDAKNPSAIPEAVLQGATSKQLVKWHGKTDDVRPIVSSADIVVLPSYREGTPRSLLEAAAMGKPLVATDVPGCRNVVQDGVNGVLVPPRDPAALADAIESLVHDPAKRQLMGGNGRKIVEDRFDERFVADITLGKYRELLKNLG